MPTFIHAGQKRFFCRNAVTLTALTIILALAACSGDEPPTERPQLVHTPLVLQPEPTIVTPPARQLATAPDETRLIQGLENTPRPYSVLDIMHLAADWQLDHPTTEDKSDWIYSTFYTGVMALGRLEKDSRYVDAMMAVGTQLGWQFDDNFYNADHHAIAQLYLGLFAVNPQPEMIQAVQQRFNYIIDFPKDDILDFTRNGATDRWSWCDALFMDPPGWAMLSKATSDPKYLDSANRRWWVTSDFLYDKDEHLYYRDSRYLTQHETNGQKVFWSRGNGWVIAGLARMLDNMPKDYTDRGKYTGQFMEMAERLKSLQQSDGMWRTSLLDPADHPQPETSGTGLITYALAWGVNNGLLDQATYAPVVFKAWDALTQCVQSSGKIIHVQPVGDHPNGFDANSSTPYGVGAFLLAGSEVYQLAGGKMPGAATPAATPQPVVSAGTGN